MMVAVVFGLVGCGPHDPGSVLASQPAAATSTAKADGSVDFTGYVEKAYPLQVSGTEFADAEQLYSQFIDKLVLPKYPDLTGPQVHLEGSFGMDSFGSASKVYMAASGDTGHLFEATTDEQSRFVVHVMPGALDEVYQARVVIRIGLEISRSPAPADHYCFLLSSIRDGIQITDTSKPIIFTDFQVQADSWRCEDVQDDGLTIPSTSTKPAGTATASDSTPTPSVPVPPHIQISKMMSVQSPLATNEDGADVLSAMAYSTDDQAYFVVKGVVRSRDTGAMYQPFIKITDQGGAVASQANMSLAGMTASPITAITMSGDHFLAVTTPGAIVATFSDDAKDVHEVGQCRSANGPYVLDCLVYGSSPTLKALAFDTSGHIYACFVDDAGGGLRDCTEQPGSNPQRVPAVAANKIVVMNGLVYFVDTDASRVVVTNDRLVYQKSYAIPAEQVPHDVLVASKWFTDGQGLLFAGLAGDVLTVWQVALVDH